jgi:hypothetical protein
VSGKTIARADLVEAIRQRIGLSRIKCGELLELVLKEIADCLERGCLRFALAQLPGRCGLKTRIPPGGVVSKLGT